VFDAAIGFSIRNRLLVLLAALALLVGGGLVAAGLPVDVFPDLNRPTVTVLTESGGLAPEEVETLVTRPLEAAMNGAPGVERVRSQSAPGLSVIWVEFAWDVDIYRARQQVTERLDGARAQLPADVRPELGPVSSIMGEILLIGLSSPDGAVTGPALRALAENTLRPRLLALPGVASINAMGGGLEQIQVEARPEDLARLGLPLSALEAGISAAQGASTGGFLARDGEELLVRNLARSADPRELADTVIATRDGVPIPLGAVADLRRGVGVMRGDAGVNGHPAVILSVQKQPGADTLTLTGEVERTLDGLRRGLPPGVELTVLFRQADFIASAVGNVEQALRDGAILVAIILVIFLGSARTTAITLTAIPLSMLVSALVLHALGLSVNTMTLGGLAVAIGELVDDAIVDVENVARRLRENRLSPAPRSVGRVILEASVEVRHSIVYSTALVVLVFVPLFALSGVEGRLFAPLGVAYIASILASMAVSLTVTPALARLLLPGAAVGGSLPRAGDGGSAPVGMGAKPALRGEQADGWLVRRLKALDRHILAFTLPRPGQLLAVTGVLVLLAMGSLPLLGRSFLPAFNEGTATINVLARPGTSLEASDQLGVLAERALLAVPEVKSTGRRTGRAELDEHAEGVHYTEIDVDFQDGGRPRAEVLADIRARLSAIPGVSVSLGQPISHRLDHLLSGVRAAIAVKIFGPELGELRAVAERVQGALRPIPGLVDLSVEPVVLIPQLSVEVDRDAARGLGVAPGELTDALSVALGGRKVGEVLDGLRPLDLVLRYAPAWREDPERVRMAPLVLSDGRALRVGQLAAVREGTGPNQVLHEDGQRRIVVSANTAGRDLGAVADDVEAALSGLSLPPGVSVAVGGQFQSQREATRRIGMLALLSLVGMIALLHAHFRSAALVAQVLLNIPLALIGAVAALWVSGADLSVATLVGFVTLCGISTRNTILMIDHYLHLVRHEGEVMGASMVIRGSLERLVPVMMTALCAGLALIPLALSGGQPGKEILTPVAQVVLGGLISSTLLDIALTPTIFLRFGGPALARLATDAIDLEP